MSSSTRSIPNLILAVSAATAWAPLGAPVAREEFTAPFAAEVLNVHGKTVERSRVNVASGKLRAEAIQGGDPKHSIAILDYTAGTVISIDPTAHTYVDMRDIIGPFAAQFARLYRVVQPVDPDQPCVEMQQMVARVDHLTQAGADSAHIQCSPMGSDTVDGRGAKKWRVTATRGARTDEDFMWVDAQLHFVTKSVDSAGTSEVLNIREGPQPPELFEVPAGYKKVTAGSLLASLKGKGLLNILSGAAKDAAQQEAEDQARNGVKSVIRSVLGQP